MREPPIVPGSNGQAAVHAPRPETVSQASRDPRGTAARGRLSLRRTWRALEESQPLAGLIWLQPEDRSLRDLQELTEGDETLCTFQTLTPLLAAAAARLYPQSSLPIPNLAEYDECAFFVKAVAYAMVDRLEDVAQNDYSAVHAAAARLTGSFFQWGDALVHSNGPEAQQAHTDLVAAWHSYATVVYDFEQKQARRLTREAELAPMRELSTALRTMLYARLRPLLEEGNRLMVASHVGNPDAFALWTDLVPYWRAQVPELHIPVETPEFKRMFVCAYAPEPDYHVDHVAACKAAREATGLLEVMVAYFERDLVKTATYAARAFNKQWQDFVTHLGAYDASIQSRMLIFADDIKLTEEQVRCFLQEELYCGPLKTRPWPKLWKMYAGDPTTALWENALHEALRAEDTSFTAAIHMVHQLRLFIERTDGHAVEALSEVLDVGPLHERQRRGEQLTAKIFYDICRKVMDYVHPEGWDAADLLRFRDFPVDGLPDMLLQTYLTARAAQDAAWAKRQRMAPDLRATAIEFERDNFTDRLDKRGGRLPGTQAWLEKMRATAVGTTLQERHAEAIGGFLVNCGVLWRQNCPEILRPSLDVLAPAAEGLNAAAVYGVAVYYFDALARHHSIPITLADRLDLQNALYALPAPHHNTAAAQVLENLARIAETRGTPSGQVSQDTLKYAHAPMTADMRNWDSPMGVLVRRKMVRLFAAAMRNHGITETATPWVRDITSRGRALHEWATVDLYVHDAYYAKHLMPPQDPEAH